MCQTVKMLFFNDLSDAADPRLGMVARRIEAVKNAEDLDAVMSGRG